ncbi:hypothetical protein [Achromobacter marplatensis]|nr:hypothetical protein [Achromobacter marplatensis]
MFDFLGAVRLAAQDTAWLGFETEGYLFVALIYFVLSAALAWAARASPR